MKADFVAKNLRAPVPPWLTLFSRPRFAPVRVNSRLPYFVPFCKNFRVSHVSRLEILLLLRWNDFGLLVAP